MLLGVVLYSVARANLEPKYSAYCHDAAFEKMLDPIAGSPATGKSVVGIVDLLVHDLFGTGGTEMEQRVLARGRISKSVQKSGTM